MGNITESARFSGLMAVFTRANGKTAEKMERVSLLGLMGQYTKESGLMESTMGKEN